MSNKQFLRVAYCIMNIDDFLGLTAVQQESVEGDLINEMREVIPPQVAANTDWERPNGFVVTIGANQVTLTRGAGNVTLANIVLAANTELAKIPTWWANNHPSPARPFDGLTVSSNAVICRICHWLTNSEASGLANKPHHDRYEFEIFMTSGQQSPVAWTKSVTIGSPSVQIDAQFRLEFHFDTRDVDDVDVS